MKEEVDAGVNFIAKHIKGDSKEEQILKFKQCLAHILIQKYTGHWYPNEPMRGQAYRCLRLNLTIVKEPSIDEAAKMCGLQYKDLKLPLEVTLWIDPNEVSCRYGEKKGSYFDVAKFKDGKSIPLTDFSDIASSKSIGSDEFSSTTSESSTIDIEEAYSPQKENISPNVNYYKRRLDLSPPVDENNNICPVSPYSPGNFRGLSVYQNDIMPHMDSPAAVSFSSSVSPLLAQSSVSNLYADYLNRDNSEFSRLSPSHLNKNLWNGGGVIPCNSIQRYQWYINRTHMARVQ